VSRVRFIPPAVPKLRASPPTGQGWSYEVKLDGFWVQLHKVGLAVTLFGKNGGNLTTRFSTIAAAAITLPKPIADGRAETATLWIHDDASICNILPLSTHCTKCGRARRIRTPTTCL